MPGPQAKNDMAKTCVSHGFSCAQFPGAEGMLKVFLGFHGQQSRVLECLVSHECKPRHFSKLDSSSTSHQ